MSRSDTEHSGGGELLPSRPHLRTSGEGSSRDQASVVLKHILLFTESTELGAAGLSQKFTLHLLFSVSPLGHVLGMGKAEYLFFK